MMIHPDISVCLISRLGNKIVLSHLEENGRIDLAFSPVVLLNKSKRKRLKKVDRLSKNVKNFFFVGGEIKKNSVFSKNIGARFVSGSIGRGFLSNDLSLLVISERCLFDPKQQEDKWQNVD